MSLGNKVKLRIGISSIVILVSAMIWPLKGCGKRGEEVLYTFPYGDRSAQVMREDIRWGYDRYKVIKDGRVIHTFTPVEEVDSAELIDSKRNLLKLSLKGYERYRPVED